MSINQLISGLSQPISTTGITVKNNNVVGYNPSVLNVYEELDLNAIVSSGCLARACDFKVMRIGKHVTLSFEGFNTSPQACTGNGSLNFLGLLTPRFYSSGIDEAVINVNFNGTFRPGMCRVYPNGDLRIFSDLSGSGWSTGQLIVVQGFSIVYTTP